MFSLHFVLPVDESYLGSEFSYLKVILVGCSFLYLL